MQTNRHQKKDVIFKAVVSAMKRQGRGFFIISCGAWIHPINTVPNCYAILFDGVVQYKFESTFQGFKVAVINDRSYLNLDIKLDQILTCAQLIEKINLA